MPLKSAPLRFIPSKSCFSGSAPASSGITSGFFSLQRFQTTTPRLSIAKCCLFGVWTLMFGTTGKLLPSTRGPSTNSKSSSNVKFNKDAILGKCFRSGSCSPFSHRATVGCATGGLNNLPKAAWVKLLTSLAFLINSGKGLRGIWELITSFTS